MRISTTGVDFSGLCTAKTYIQFVQVIRNISCIDIPHVLSKLTIKLYCTLNTVKAVQNILMDLFLAKPLLSTDAFGFVFIKNQSYKRKLTFQ